MPHDNDYGFTDSEAKRASIPLLLGVVGPSGSGKTYSALELATGIQRVCGGDIYFGDSENKRALHYADRFKFRHVPFEAPFSSRRYLDLLRYFEQKKAKIAIVDSVSHEHEGPGGYLALHEQILEEKSHGDAARAERIKLGCWKEPKQQRRQFINAMLQMGMNLIFCYRAEPKLKIVTGEDPLQVGYMPIAGKDFIWEMTVKFLLLPGSVGTPVWKSDFPGESAVIKLPAQFLPIFDVDPPVQLSADIGERMARWALGGDVGPATKAVDITDLVAGYTEVKGPESRGTFEALQIDIKEIWPRLDAAQKKALTAASTAAKARVSKAA